MNNADDDVSIKRNKFNKVLALIAIGCSIVLLSSFTQPVQMVGSESENPNESSISDIRYWKHPFSGQNMVETQKDREMREQQVPKRTDPKILVVLYHNLVFGRSGNVYNRDMYNFEHDLQFLRRNFTIIDFDTLQEIQEGIRDIDTDVAIITFDDGDLSMYAIAFPLLKEFNIKATFFLVSDYVGQVGYMSWKQAKEIADYRNHLGEKLFTLGSHTVTHRALATLSEAEILKELADSKRIIEANTGQTITVLALPFGSGRRSPIVLETAKACGYRFLRHSEPFASTIIGTKSFDIPALNVENYSTDVFVQKAMKLTGR
jgi:peptidoglycan/xylan/chitin deacetylase (PgdA/CDA1 family)